MDNQKFDKLTRAFASGSSRRSLLKGLLGLGGAASLTTVLSPDSEARRSSGSRRRTTTTPAPCPAGTSPCDTNSTGCCADCGTEFTCGYDCCTEPIQCCDGECCPGGTVCLTVAFGGETAFIAEETCCPTELTCDDRCCDGECFYRATPEPPDANGLELGRECCPAGYEICDTGQGLTCIDPSVQCCDKFDCPTIYGGEDACWSCLENNCVAATIGDRTNCDVCHECDANQACAPYYSGPDPEPDCGFDPDSQANRPGYCCAGTCNYTFAENPYCPVVGQCCEPLQGQACCNDGCCDGQCLDDGTCCPSSYGFYCVDTCCPHDEFQHCTTLNGVATCVQCRQNFHCESGTCCDNTCCHAGESCIGDSCCPAAQMCGASCCDAATERCCNDQCIPNGNCCDNDDCPANACNSSIWTTYSCNTDLGSCVSSSQDCRDDNPCTSNSCSPIDGCGVSNVTCDFVDECTSSTCDPTANPPCPSESACAEVGGICCSGDQGDTWTCCV